MVKPQSPKVTSIDTGPLGLNYGYPRLYDLSLSNWIGGHIRIDLSHFLSFSFFSFVFLLPNSSSHPLSVSPHNVHQVKVATDNLKKTEYSAAKPISLVF